MHKQRSAFPGLGPKPHKIRKRESKETSRVVDVEKRKGNLFRANSEQNK